MNVTQFDPGLLERLYRPPEDSHKGENGKLLVIGGSKLFHASIFWSAEVAVKIVDLVHFTSPAMENNDLVRIKAKEKLWSGIVVPFEEVETYIEEDDVILIGPGMPREEGLMEGERPTKEIVDGLLSKFPDKKWVVDGGALQEVEPGLLNGKMIVTPHQKEFERLLGKMDEGEATLNALKISEDTENFRTRIDQISVAEVVAEVSKTLKECTILLKGKTDLVVGGRKWWRLRGGMRG
jgi:NAD(P)H-hydrate repair Nnr-like enzyme with NAD(P)H-hydrate dehydratase domain